MISRVEAANLAHDYLNDVGNRELALSALEDEIHRSSYPSTEKDIMPNTTTPEEPTAAEVQDLLQRSWDGDYTSDPALTAHSPVKHDVEDKESECAMCTVLRARRQRTQDRRRRLRSYLDG